MKKAIWFVVSICVFASCNSKQGNDAVMKEEYQLLDSLTTLFEQGDLEGSINGLQIYMINNPSSDVGFNLLGTIYIAMYEDSMALINVKKSLELNPKNYGTLTNYGILLDRQGEHKKAFNYYLQSINIKPDFVQAYSNLMGNRVSVGDLENARKFGERAVYYGNNTTDKGLLCAIYHKLGEYNKRDSLLYELKKLGYENINQLEEVLLKN